MKKIMIVGLLIMSTMLSAFQTSQSLFVGEDGVTLNTSDGYVFMYPRMNLSIKNQNETEVYKTLHKGACQNAEMSASIKSGSKFKFIYVYKDGTMLIEINDCY